MTGLEQAFAVCAAIGGVLFVFRLVAQLLGLHHDVALEIHSGDLDVTHSDIGFKLLSFQTMTAFLMMFGLVGFALARVEKLSTAFSLIGAVIAGGATAWLVALLFRGMGRLQSAGDYNPAQAIGQRGSVYLTIPAGGTGKVTVTVNNRLSVLDAVAEDKSEMKTGVAVEVLEIVAQNILVVKRV